MKKSLSLLLTGLSIMLPQFPFVSGDTANTVNAAERLSKLTFINESFTELDIIDYIDSSLEYSVRIYECPDLEIINIPEQVKEVEIISCLSLKEISVTDENSEYSSIDGILYDKEAENLILYPSARADVEFTVPDGVKRIKERSFANSSVGVVSLPDSLESIGESAFYECAGLKRINIPANLCGRCDNIFWGCDALKEIIFCDTGFSPDYFSATEDEENTRFIDMLNNNLSQQIVVYAPDENFDNYYLLSRLWENKNTVMIPVSMKRNDGRIAFDINGDSFISIADLVTLNSFLLGRLVENAFATDIDQDGAADAFDLVLMRIMLIDNYYHVL